MRMGTIHHVTLYYTPRVFFGRRTSSWYAIMPLTKVCPQCSAIEHCRRSVCTNCAYILENSLDTIL